MEGLIAPIGANRKKTIVGRGYASKGRCCGRGNNGQNARSGGGVRPGFEGGQMPLYRRVARRGFSNFLFKEECIPVSLDILDKVYETGEDVTDETLRKKGILKGVNTRAKILKTGKITKALKIKGVKVSSTAAEEIKKAGGSVEEKTL